MVRGWGGGWVGEGLAVRTAARMPPHAIKPHEWGTRCMGGFDRVWASPYLPRVDGFEFGKEDDALLLVGVGAGDDGGDGFGSAGVVGEVGDVGGDVEEVAGADDGVVLEALAVPDTGFASEGADGSLVGGVLVGAGAAAGRDGDELHVEGF